MSVAARTERPLDLFVTAIGMARRGISPNLSMKEVLEMTNLTSPLSDGWVIEDRMFGGPPESLNPLPLYTDHFLLKWRGITIGRVEKKVKERKANRAEEQVVKLMTGVFIAHQIRREELCVPGKAKINAMNRQRPDLVFEVLDEIMSLNGAFPAPAEIGEYKRRVLMSAVDPQYIP